MSASLVAASACAPSPTRFQLIRARIGAWRIERRKPGSVMTFDQQTIDIDYAWKCALAQTYGDYYDAPFSMRLGRYLSGYFALGENDIAGLNEAWRTVIDEYRARYASALVPV